MRMRHGGSVVRGRQSPNWYSVYSRQPFLAAGAVIWVASMLASAFCTEIWQFFITMVRPLS